MTDSTEPQPAAGWYDDPRVAARARWWDGTRWTGHIWIPAPPAQPARSARLAVVLGGVLTVMWLGGFWLYATHHTRGASFIDDEQFIAAADRICELAEQRRPRPAGEHATMAHRAEVVDESTRVFADMVRQLRALPVSAEDREEVEVWLDTWEAYIAIGPRYSDAIRRNDPAYVAIGNEGDGPAGDVNTFARNNGMDNCIF